MNVETLWDELRPACIPGRETDPDVRLDPDDHVILRDQFECDRWSTGWKIINNKVRSNLAGMLPEMGPVS